MHEAPALSHTHTHHHTGGFSPAVRPPQSKFSNSGVIKRRETSVVDRFSAMRTAEAKESSRSEVDPSAFRRTSRYAAHMPIVIHRWIVFKCELLKILPQKIMVSFSWKTAD